MAIAMLNEVSQSTPSGSRARTGSASARCSCLPASLSLARRFRFCGLSSSAGCHPSTSRVWSFDRLLATLHAAAHADAHLGRGIAIAAANSLSTLQLGGRIAVNAMASGTRSTTRALRFRLHRWSTDG